MSAWTRIEAEAPEIAAAGRRLLGEVAFLATVSGNGRPRVHPFCPAIVAGRVWAFVMEQSPKRRDLDVNGHFAIHALPGPQDEEFYLAGRASQVLDVQARERVLEAMPYDDADEAHRLYQFEPDRALWTTWENFQQPGMRPVHRVWSSMRSDPRRPPR